MDDEGNDKVLEFKRPPAAVEADPFWPDLDAPYRAAGDPADDEIPRLLVVMGKEAFQPGGTAYYALPYPHIGMGGFGYDADGEWFRFDFSGLRPKRLTVHGRNLMRVCDAIACRRMPWIRQADRDFPTDGDAPVIPSITIEEVTEEE